MTLQYMHVSAFTRTPGEGNSAGVIQLPEWPADDELAKLARAIDLPVTSVIVQMARGIELRWLSRSGGFVKSMCGHGTLAASLAVTLLHPDKNVFSFLTPGGVVDVERCNDEFRLALPRWQPHVRPGWRELNKALGSTPSELFDGGRDVLAVFRSEDEVRGLRPDMRLLHALGHRGYIATAPGRDYDCVSRFFCPTFGLGVDEDPVTGSAHCAIAPFWSERLGKPILRAFQASAAPGELTCEVIDNAVIISASAVFRSYEFIDV